MMVNQRITDLRKAFNIPNHFNPGILGILIYYPYKPKKYYIDALKYFSEIEINQVILFSDNEDIAANYFPNSYPISKSGKTIDEFLKICMCEHLIVDKSEYGYLAAILNPNKDKIIVHSGDILL
jgi:hypothetical protein